MRRERRLVDPRTREYRVRVLEPGDVAGERQESAGAGRVRRERASGVPRADALLAGFSNAVIARAVEAGALIEREIVPRARDEPRQVAEP